MPTAEEKQAYLDEVKAAQEEAEAGTLEPTSPDITESEWAEMLARQGQDDAKWLFTVTEESGGPNVVADPEPVEPPIDESGGEVGEGGELPPEEATTSSKSSKKS
jgi:hypothetical protein